MEVEALSGPQRLYFLVCDEDIGRVFTYKELNDVVGYDVREKRYPINKVNNILLEERKTMLVNVRKVGFKLANAQEQLNQGDKHYRKSRKEIRKCRMVLTHLDVSELSDEERKRHTMLLDRATEIERTLLERKKSGRPWTDRMGLSVNKLTNSTSEFIQGASSKV